MGEEKIEDAVDDAPICLPDEEAAAPAPTPAADGRIPMRPKRGGVWVPPEGYVNKDEAFKIFCEMGRGRTLARVEKTIADMKRPGPARSTLKSWSAENNWAEKATLYDMEVAAKADEIIKAKKAESGARECMDLASSFRKTADKLIKRLEQRITNIKVKSGSEAKAMAEAAVALNRAAEVLDGGVGDRTEHRETVTLEERENAAAAMVEDIFKQLRTSKGNDNKPVAGAVGDAPDAARSARGV